MGRRDDSESDEPTDDLFDIPSQVNAGVVRDTILAAIAIVGARLSVGNLDEGRNVAAYAKLLEFAKDFTAIASSIDKVASFGKADAVAIDVPRTVSETMRRVRALTKKTPGR